MNQQKTNNQEVSQSTEEIERLRAYRQEKADRKAARIRSWGESKLRQAQELEDSIPEYTHDWAYITQPGHIPGRDKINRKQEKIYRLREEGKRQIEKAERISKYGARVKGDAERARELVREEQDKTIGKGSRVRDFCFGDGEVVRVNTKTYSIKFDHGGTYARDKTFVNLIQL